MIILVIGSGQKRFLGALRRRARNRLRAAENSVRSRLGLKPRRRKYRRKLSKKISRSLQNRLVRPNRRRLLSLVNKNYRAGNIRKARLELRRQQRALRIEKARRQLYSEGLRKGATALGSGNRLNRRQAARFALTGSTGQRRGSGTSSRPRRGLRLNPRNQKASEVLARSRRRTAPRPPRRRGLFGTTVRPANSSRGLFGTTTRPRRPAPAQRRRGLDIAPRTRSTASRGVGSPRNNRRPLPVSQVSSIPLPPRAGIFGIGARK